MIKIFHHLVYLSIIITFAGCATKHTGNLPNSATEANLSEGQAVKEYEFQIGDVFDVKFFEFPELDQMLTVRPDGRISLPLVEDLLVVGMTPSALDRTITERYRAKIKEPEVTIILRQFAGQKVYVGGEVNNPGLLQLTGRLTLLQSLFNAGGFKRSAKLNSVVHIRNIDNKPELRMIDVDTILNRGEHDILLKPYDVVFVPKTFIAKADDFVDQYINQIIPNAVRFGLNFLYLLNDRDSSSGRTVVIGQ